MEVDQDVYNSYKNAKNGEIIQTIRRNDQTTAYNTTILNPNENREEIDEKNTKSKCSKYCSKKNRLQCISVTCLILSCLSVFIAFLGPDVYINDVLSNIRNRRLLIEKNKQNILSNFYESYGIPQYLEFRFFNFTNADLCYLKGVKPKFVEMKEKLYYQLDENFNITSWNDNQTQAKVHYDVKFNPSFNNTEEYKDLLNSFITIPNIPSINLWQTLKKLPQEKLAQIALGHLKDQWSHEDSFHLEIMTNVLVQKINDDATFFDRMFNKSFPSENENVQSLRNVIDVISNDEVYGLKNKDGCKKWISSSLSGFKNNDFSEQIEYFDIGNLYSYFDEIETFLNITIQEVEKTMFEKLNISYPIDTKLYPSGVSSYLADRQWGESWVTKTVFPDYKNNGTINCLNESRMGYPEIHYFFEEKFYNETWLTERGYDDKNPEIKKLIDYYKEQQKDEKVILFDYEISRRLMALEMDPKKPFKTSRDVLLHAGNMNHIFRYGLEFEENKSLIKLNTITDRFKLGNDNFRALVLWDYLNYLATDYLYVEKNPEEVENVVREKNIQSTLKGFFVPFRIRNNFHKTRGLIKYFLMYKMIYHNFLQKDIFCIDLVSASLGKASTWNFNAFCENFGIREDHDSTITKKHSLLDLVYYAINPIWSKNGGNLAAMYGFTKEVADKFVAENTNTESLYYTIKQFETYLFTEYRCQQKYDKSIIYPKCSGHELAVKQFVNSTITRFPPEDFPSEYKSGLTLKDWMPEIFDIDLFEFKFVLDKFNITGMPIIEAEDANKIQSNERLFSRLPVIKAYTECLAGDCSYTENYLLIKNHQFFQKFIDYAMLQGVMNGFSLTIKYQDIMDGFNTEFTNDWKNGNPSLGFNPVSKDNINLLPKERIVDLTLHTGLDKIDYLGKMYHFNNSDSISTMQKEFDGNDTHIEKINPWAKEVAVNYFGTHCNPISYQNYNMKNRFDDTPIFNSEIEQPLIYNFVSEKKFKNSEKLKTSKWVLNSKTFANKTNNPANALFFQDKYNGLLNLTSPYKIPLFYSNYWLDDVDPILRNTINLYDRNNNYIEPKNVNKLDIQSYYEIETKTMIPVNSSIKLQSNLLIESDSMWSHNENLIMPIYKMERKLRIKQEDFNQIFGHLEKMYIYKFYIMIIFFVLSIVFIITGLLICMVTNDKIKGNQQRKNIKKRIEEVKKTKYDQIIQRNLIKLSNNMDYSLHSISFSSQSPSKKSSIDKLESIDLKYNSGSNDINLPLNP